MPLIPYVYLPETTQAFLVLLTIQPSDGAPPLLVVNNNANIVSRGKTYLGYPFNVILPPDTGDRQQTVRLAIDNVDQAIMEEMRRLLEPPEITLELVLSGSPSTVEKKIDFLRLRSINYDAFVIEGILEPVSMMTSAFPGEVYTGVNYPDLAF